MESILRYGTASSICLDLPGQTLVADCSAPRGRALDDPAAVLRTALEAPLDFPPLSRAIVPGDRVALAVDADLPQPEAGVLPLVESLLDCGLAAGDLTVLCAACGLGEDERALQNRLAALLPPGVALVTHEPADRSQIAYLASTTTGRPIYLNRVLCDADVVIPMGCLRSAARPGRPGPGGGLYPTFADARTLARYRHPSLAEPSSAPAQQARREVEEVDWLLGIYFTVQVVPGAGEAILQVLAGRMDAVVRQGQVLCDAAWSHSVPRRAKLVVAGIEGDASRQTWDNVGRALAAAAVLVDDDGAIAICSELAQEPGAGVRQVATSDNPGLAARRLRKDRPHDTFAAVALAQALQRAKIYLLSGLDEAVVEELGLAPVSEPESIARLARRHTSCIVLGSAHRAVALTNGQYRESIA